MNILIPAAIVALALLLILLFALGSRGGNQYASYVVRHERNRKAGRYCPGRCRWCHDERVDADHGGLLAEGFSEQAAEAEIGRRYRRGDYGER